MQINFDYKDNVNMNLFHLSTLYYIHNINVYLHVLYFKVLHACYVQVFIYLIFYKNLNVLKPIQCLYKVQMKYLIC